MVSREKLLVSCSCKNYRSMKSYFWKSPTIPRDPYQHLPYGVILSLSTKNLGRVVLKVPSNSLRVLTNYLQSFSSRSPYLVFHCPVQIRSAYTLFFILLANTVILFCMYGSQILQAYSKCRRTHEMHKFNKYICSTFMYLIKVTKGLMALREIFLNFHHTKVSCNYTLVQ